MKQIVASNYEEIKRIILEIGINPAYLEFAKKSDFDLPKILYSKILKYCNEYYESDYETKRRKCINIEEGIKEISSNLYGILGNYYACKYLTTKAGFETKIEVDLKDEQAGIISKADIALVGKNGNELYCEVKAIDKILGNGFVDSDIQTFSYRKDWDDLKYNKIGIKLVNQLTRLSNFCPKPIAIVFNDCKLDNGIRNKINELGALFTIPDKSFKEIQEETEIILNTIVEYFKRNVILDTEALDYKKKKHKRKSK